MKRLLKTFHCENGKLYSITAGRRIYLAGCTVLLQVMEERTSVPVLKIGAAVRSYHVTIAVCAGMDLTRDVDVDFLKTVSAFDIEADVQRPDGIYEVLDMKNISAVDIELGGEWIFEADDPELSRKLLGY